MMTEEENVNETVESSNDENDYVSFFDEEPEAEDVEEAEEAEETEETEESEEVEEAEEIEESEETEEAEETEESEETEEAEETEESEETEEAEEIEDVEETKKHEEAEETEEATNAKKYADEDVNELLNNFPELRGKDIKTSITDYNRFIAIRQSPEIRKVITASEAYRICGGKYTDGGTGKTNVSGKEHLRPNASKQSTTTSIIPEDEKKTIAAMFPDKSAKELEALYRRAKYD